MTRVCCPACYSSIDPRSSRCWACHAVLERVPGGAVGVVTVSVYAVVSNVKGCLVGLFVGPVVQVICGLPHVALVVATGCAVMSGVHGYWSGSTRLRERRSGVGQNSDITVYIADRLQVLYLRR